MKILFRTVVPSVSKLDMKEKNFTSREIAHIDCDDETSVCPLSHHRQIHNIRLSTFEGNILSCLFLSYVLTILVFAFFYVSLLTSRLLWMMYSHTGNCITVHKVIKSDATLTNLSQLWDCYNFTNANAKQTLNMKRQICWHVIVWVYTNSHNWISCIKLDTKTRVFNVKSRS